MEYVFRGQGQDGYEMLVELLLHESVVVPR
jgi:hypothetical protein